MAKEYKQVICDEKITSSKSFNDYLYGWLVLKANGDRKIEKKSFVYSQVEGELGMTRKTIAKYFEWLLEEGLVEDGGDWWILKDLGDKGFWIEIEVLKRLIGLRQRYAVSAYVYLVSGNWIAGQKELVVLMENIKRFLGISVNVRSNNYIVTDMFEIFREMGLLNCQLWYDKENNKRFYKLTGIGKSNYF